jgi:hypothetical protein
MQTSLPIAKGKSVPLVAPVDKIDEKRPVFAVHIFVFLVYFLGFRDDMVCVLLGPLLVSPFIAAAGLAFLI